MWVRVADASRIAKTRGGGTTRIEEYMNALSWSGTRRKWRRRVKEDQGNTSRRTQIHVGESRDAKHTAEGRDRQLVEQMEGGRGLVQARDAFKDASCVRRGQDRF